MVDSAHPWIPAFAGMTNNNDHTGKLTFDIFRIRLFLK